MTPSLASRLVRYAPSIRRAHEQYATEAATRAAMAALRAGPPTFAPPQQLGRRVRVSQERSVGRWPVFTVRPGGGSLCGRVVFLHGGAYFRELRTWHWRFVAYLSRTSQVSCLLPVYPLAPVGTAETVVPAVVDLLSGVLAEPGPVVLAGDSAGAGMAIAVAQELAARAAPGLAGLLLVSPWVDVSCADPGLAARAPRDPWLQVPGLRAAGDAYRSSLPVDHPWVSPVHGELAGLPPMLVLSGTDDILNADAQRLVSAVRAVGSAVELVEAAGMIHDYPLLPTPEGRSARALAARWLTERLEGDGLSRPGR